MDYQDIDVWYRTLESYQQALENMFEVCKFVKPSSYAHGNICTAFKPVSHSKLIPKAHRVYVSWEELTEWPSSRPKQFSARSHVWEHDFFKTSFSCVFPYEIFGWVSAVRRKKKTTPAKIVRTKRGVVLRWDGKTWGLRDWKTKRKEIFDYCDGASDKVREAYHVDYHKADKEVKKWVELNEKLKPLVIPT